MATKITKSLDLGKLQETMEQAARNLKSATTTATRAVDAMHKADAEYSVAQKALSAGVDQLRAATKVA